MGMVINLYNSIFFFTFAEIFHYYVMYVKVSIRTKEKISTQFYAECNSNDINSPGFCTFWDIENNENNPYHYHLSVSPKVVIICVPEKSQGYRMWVNSISDNYPLGTFALGTDGKLGTIVIEQVDNIPDNVGMISGNENGNDYVDLGLSVNWATCNLGASKPSDYGMYFAWGETKPQLTPKNRELYKYFSRRSEFETNILKYCMDEIKGVVDNKIFLELSDDAANVNWGGKWRMPTTREFEELVELCFWKWVLVDGVKGCKVIGPNGKNIFLPAAGVLSRHMPGDGIRGTYWTNELSTWSSFYANALHIDFSCPKNQYFGSPCRDIARPIRPVF